MKSEDAVLALAALAQGTRLDTFRLLVASEPEGVAAGELARRIGVPQNTMSAHLSILARAGLVNGERRSRTIIYRAELGAFRDLTVFMIKDCCGGHPDLCVPITESLRPCVPQKKKARDSFADRAGRDTASSGRRKPRPGSKNESLDNA